MIDVVRRTADQVFMPLTVGGGIRTIDDIRDLLQAGCDKVSLNSIACKNPDFIRQASERFGAQCIVVNMDPRRVIKDGKEFWEVFIHGGRTPTGIEVVEWAQRVEELGAGEIVVTSMDRDGTKDGYDLPITQAVSKAVSIPVVASGGAGNPQHMVEAILMAQADAVLAASIFHFGQYTIAQTKHLMAQNGIPVRLA
jgi:cyclase